MKKLIFHPGFHKTGTTALQQALTEARKELKVSDFNYPNTRGKAHHSAAWAITQKTWGWEKRGGRLINSDEWEKLEKKIASSDKTSIISSEFFSTADPVQLTKLGQHLKDYETKVIFTWRPLPFMLASSYQQYLKYGVRVSYKKWLVEMFENSESTKMTPSFWKRNHHGDVIESWIKVFGSQNVSLIAVDESKPDFLYESFAELAGISSGVLTKPKAKEINRSLTFNEAALLLEINKRYPKDGDWDSYSTFIRSGNIKALTSSEIICQSDEKIMTPQWALGRAIEINSQSVAKIKSLGIEIIGDLDRSDFSKIPVGVNTPVTTISIETAARAMIGVNMKSLRRMPSSAIVREFKKRLRKRIKRTVRIKLR
jgi:hypothetical protein